jgi:hypothetical protein
MIGMRHRMHEHRASVMWGQRQQSHSVAISRRNLETLLQRTLSDVEVTAVAAVWRQTGQRGMAHAAHRMFRETYTRFIATNPLRRHRRRVRIAKARAWVTGAAVHAKQGNVLDALQYLGYALRWHPLGFVSGLASIAARAAAYVRRNASFLRAPRLEDVDPSRLDLG